jgi:hypothetical protein
MRMIQTQANHQTAHLIFLQPIHSLTCQFQKRSKLLGPVLSKVYIVIQTQKTRPSY